MNIQVIIEKIQRLPFSLQKEVLDYIDFLTNRYKIRNKDKRFSFYWEGGLKELKNEFTSVELQHKVKDYR
jgi:hypothetical protein